MLLRRRFTQDEILDRIRRAEESILVYLYEYNYVTFKNGVHQRGGNDTQARSFLRYALVECWRFFQKNDPEAGRSVHEHVVEYGWEAFEQYSEVLYPLEASYSQPVKQFSAYMRYLDSNCRQILFYRHFEGFEEEELASRLNFESADKVQRKALQCKRRLASLIRQNFNPSEWMSP